MISCLEKNKFYVFRCSTRVEIELILEIFYANEDFICFTYLSTIEQKVHKLTLPPRYIRKTYTELSEYVAK